MFTGIPANLSSLYLELTYSYYTSHTGDFTFKIFENQTDKLLGVKKFYQTTTVQLNIAPHIRPFAIPNIELHEMGFVTPYRQGNVSVYVTVDDNSAASGVRQFSISRGAIETPGLVTSLPSVRSISAGESELLQICCESNGVVTVEVKEYLTPYERSYEKPYLEGEFVEELVDSHSYSSSVADGKLLLFNYVARSNRGSSEQSVERAVVTVTQGSAVLAEVAYHIVEPMADAVRVAWLSESGSVEHYTFPVVKSLSLGEDFLTTLELVSAFEGYAVRVALAEIVRSSRVWVLADGEYVAASVDGGGVSVSAGGELGSVAVRVAY